MSLLADHGIKKRFLVAAAIFMILMLVSEFELMPRDMVVSVSASAKPPVFQAWRRRTLISGVYLHLLLPSSRS